MGSVKLLNYQQKDAKKTPIDWDSFAIPSERGLNVDEYMKEMRENAKSERKEVFSKLEQLRRKGTVTDDKEELVSYREEKFIVNTENSLEI